MFLSLNAQLFWKKVEHNQIYLSSYPNKSNDVCEMNSKKNY